MLFLLNIMFGRSFHLSTQSLLRSFFHWANVEISLTNPLWLGWTYNLSKVGPFRVERSTNNYTENSRYKMALLQKKKNRSPHLWWILVSNPLMLLNCNDYKYILFTHPYASVTWISRSGIVGFCVNLTQHGVPKLNILSLWVLFLWRILIHWVKGYVHLSLVEIAKLSYLEGYNNSHFHQ